MGIAPPRLCSTVIPSALKSKGYTTQRLVKVPQAGCKYEGARLK